MRELHPHVLKEGKEMEAECLYAYPDPGSLLHRRAGSRYFHRWGHEPAAKIMAELPADIAGLSGAPWTIGIGHTGPEVGPEMKLTSSQVARLFDQDLDKAQTAVERYVKAPLNDFQYGALVLFAFNIGVGGFATSGVVRALRKGNYAGVPDEMRKWHKVKDRDDPKQKKLIPNAGLKNRREAEIRLWLYVPPEHKQKPCPAAKPATPEPKPASESKTLVGNSVAGVATAGAVAAEQAEKLDAVKDYSQVLMWVFILLILLGIGLSTYAKLKERKEEKG